MWAILGQSFPLSLRHLSFRKGHSLITSLVSVAGSPSFGTKDRSLGQMWNSRVLREMRLCRLVEAMDFKLRRFPNRRVVRDVGRRRWEPKKESRSWNGPWINSSPREVSVSRPHPDGGHLIFSQSEIESYLRLGFKNASGEDTTSGQLHRFRSWRNVRFCSMFPGIDSNCWQSQMSRISSVEGK